MIVIVELFLHIMCDRRFFFIARLCPIIRIFDCTNELLSQLIAMFGVLLYINLYTFQIFLKLTAAQTATLKIRKVNIIKRIILHAFLYIIWLILFSLN